MALNLNELIDFALALSPRTPVKQSFPLHVTMGPLQADGTVTVDAVISRAPAPEPKPEPAPEPPTEPPPAPEPEPEPAPPAVEDIAPLNGWLRSSTNNTFGDDRGPRSVRFCSYFPLVGVMQRNPDFAKRQMDLMVGRYHGARIFWCLLHPGAWVPMNASVDPNAPWFESALRTTLEELWQRGLRAQLTAGDLQYLPSGTNKHDLYRRVAGLCASVNQQVVALTEVVNEARVNSNEKEDWPYWAELSGVWQSVYPWGMHGLSDPGTMEEPDPLRDASRAPATCALIHGTRMGISDSIRRAFNLRYDGRVGKPIAEGEPTGMDTGAKPGVFEGTANRGHIFGLYAAKILTGQFLTHFDSAGLGWHHYDLDREWGFKEMPALWKAMGIPEDIGLYRLVPGHRNDAPITVKSFADRGEGPERCDNMSVRDGSKGYAVLHGGSGYYEPLARQDCTYRYWFWHGPKGEWTVGGGELMTRIDSGVQAVVIQWEKR